MWEGAVAIGMTPQMQLSEFGYPNQAREALSGKYEYFVSLTAGVLNTLGEVLQELEEAIV